MRENESDSGFFSLSPPLERINLERVKERPSPTDYVFDVYEKLEVLGQGVFGVVYKVRRESDNAIFALKVAKSKSMVGIAGKEMIKEFDILKLISSPKVIGGPGCQPDIVCYYDLFLARPVESRKDQAYCMLTEFIPGFTLEQYMSVSKGVVSNQDLRKISKKLLTTLSHLAEYGIAHRDIKPSNIMFNTDRLVLIDFGLACLIDQCTGFGGTPRFISPELWLVAFGYLDVNELPKEAYLAADVWSLGITLLILATGATNYVPDERKKFPPKMNKGPKKRLEYALSEITPPVDLINTIKDENMRDVIGEMLRLDYRTRNTAKESLAVLGEVELGE